MHLVQNKIKVYGIFKQYTQFGAEVTNVLTPGKKAQAGVER